MSEKSEVIELPLFPLNTVLFPGQLLPLHIFEDRYRLMIRRCLAEELPFGVILLRRGQETGDAEAEPYEVGTMARIIESTHLPDGTMNIVTVGTERFRVRRLLRDQPYLRGQIESFPLPEATDPTRAADLARHVRGQVTRYIELIASAAGLQLQVGEVPTAPWQVGFLAAVAMQIDNSEKQRLLTSISQEEVLKVAMQLLRRENALLAWMAGSKDWPQQVQYGPSGTLLPN